ncbi:MAG: tetratricopeptide repeat protein [Planctomycetota bacterium]|nr:MAG: tetratricopeptide repeat protein [Planctomycetota bacterium]
MTMETPIQDRPAGGSDDSPYIEAGVGQGSLAIPIKFAMHALFYCAGRAADKIVSLYSGAFKLDKAYVADFNKSSGIACAKNGHWEKAIPLLEKALTVTPGDTDIRMQLAEAYGTTNQPEKAGQHLKIILEANPNSAQTLRALGTLYMRRQDYDHAVEYLEKAVELDPDHPQAYYRLGSAYDNKKQYDRAVESFRKTISLDPRFAKAYQALGFTYESMGERQSAIECFKKALELE